jgi:hypothetical protein
MEISRSGTTKIYQQLLGTETVIPSGTPSSSLCEGRPLAWCQKDTTSRVSGLGGWVASGFRLMFVHLYNMNIYVYKSVFI